MSDDAAQPEMMEYHQLQSAAQVGAGLRAVREQLGWKLPDVAETLRIRQVFIEAIERGELAALPGPAYQTGFVRSYAQLLGLDPDEILRRFRAEGGMGNAPKAELSFLAPVPDRAVPAGATVLLCVVLVLVGYGLWYRHSAHERRLAQAVPSVPAELAPLALPPKPVAPPPAPKPAAKPAIVNPAPAPAVTPAPAPAAPPVSAKVITATADSWVEVKDATGNILFSKVLRAGDSWPVPDEAGLTMTTGNAGGTEIISNGKTGAPLGATGAVLHGYALTPAAPSATAK